MSDKGNRRGWTPDECNILREVWRDQPPKRIHQRLPGRTWDAIQSRASLLKLKRTYRGKILTSRVRPKSRLYADLIKGRLKAGLTQAEVAKLVGIRSQDKVAHLEGGASMSLFMLNALCDGLGLELRAQPKPGRPRRPQKMRTIVQPKHGPLTMAEQAIVDMKAWRDAKQKDWTHQAKGGGRKKANG